MALEKQAWQHTLGGFEGFGGFGVAKHPLLDNTLLCGLLSSWPFFLCRG